MGQMERGGEGRPPCLVVAGTTSSVGKTSVSIGLMAALRARGLTVQSFKVGPDFIDPMHHEQATGRPSINLDAWMLSREQVLASFHRAVEGADVAVVEGVMGLFDGMDGQSEQGSTAQLAKWLGAPVLLVLDCSAVARSAAAVVKGYLEFDPELQLGGLLFNKVGGEAHTQWLKDAIASGGITLPVLGGIPQSKEVAMPERHHGLHMPGEDSIPPDLVASLAELVGTHVDLDALLEVAATARRGCASRWHAMQPSASITTIRWRCCGPRARSWCPSRRWPTAACRAACRASIWGAATPSATRACWPLTAPCAPRCAALRPPAASCMPSAGAWST